MLWFSPAQPTAGLQRLLLHNAHHLVLTGDSYRARANTRSAGTRDATSREPGNKKPAAAAAKGA